MVVAAGWQWQTGSSAAASQERNTIRLLMVAQPERLHGGEIFGGQTKGRCPSQHAERSSQAMLVVRGPGRFCSPRGVTMLSHERFCSPRGNDALVDLAG